MAGVGRPDRVHQQGEDNEPDASPCLQARHPAEGEPSPNHALPDEHGSASRRKYREAIGRRTDPREEGQVIGHRDPSPKKAEDGGHGNTGPGPWLAYRYHGRKGHGDEDPLNRPHGGVVVTENTVELFDREWKHHSRSD